MTEEVAQGRVNVMKVQYFVTQGNLFGTRAVLEEGDDAFQGHTGLPDADYTVCVLVEGELLARGQVASVKRSWLRILR